MTIWADTGQPEAAAALRAAAAAAVQGDGSLADSNPDGPAQPASRSAKMTHAWLLSGPAGSGRSTLARAFAAALIAGTPDADRQTLSLIEAGTHPDLYLLGTEGVIIKISDVREAVKRAHFAPSVGRYRVVVVEDADRMTEHTSNVLLKELEEPAPSTVWVLCAPSEADLLPTIRSRVRTVRLRIPDVATVASIVAERTGVDPALALRAARLAQSHVGMAVRLATSAEARERRAETIAIALGVNSTREAVEAAARLIAIAGEDAAAVTAERDAEERETTFRALGLEPGAAVPAALRAQIRALEEDQKRRATRGLRDSVDRILTDLGSLYRDILLIQLGSDLELVNEEHAEAMRAAAGLASGAMTVATLDALATARSRIAANVNPTLALEAFMLDTRRTPGRHGSA